MREQADDLFFRMLTFTVFIYFFIYLLRFYYSGKVEFDDLEKYFWDKSILTEFGDKSILSKFGILCLIQGVEIIWVICMVHLICNICYFVLCVLIFCFWDPLTLEQFRNWALAAILPFSNACSTFALWIFEICKTVFQNIKTKAQNVFSIFYNW